MRHSLFVMLTDENIILLLTRYNTPFEFELSFLRPVIVDSLTSFLGNVLSFFVYTKVDCPYVTRQSVRFDNEQLKQQPRKTTHSPLMLLVLHAVNVVSLMQIRCTELAQNTEHITQHRRMCRR